MLDGIKLSLPHVSLRSKFNVKIYHEKLKKDEKSQRHANDWVP